MNESAIDSDIASVATTPVMWLAGGSLVAAAIFTVLTGIQLLGVVFAVRSLSVVPYAQVAVGLVAIPIAIAVSRGRTHGAFAATVLSILLTLFGAAWLVYLLVGGVLSLAALLAPPSALLAAIFASAAIRPCRRASDARARLAEQGLSTGL